MCHKHRLTVVFYKNEKFFPISPDSNKYDPNDKHNDELIEIKDPEIVK